MSHIFGLEHSVSGILDQLNPFNFGAPTPITQFSPLDTPNLPVLVNGGGGAGGCCPTTSKCAPGRVAYEIVTSVGCDGTRCTTTRRKTRKRRRRIATDSDIADLTALVSVLGKGKSFDMYLATRGRR